MRLKGLLLGDIKFQIKYGIYFLYVAITVIYLVILSFVPSSVKKVTASIIIFTDPAVLGLFFMGAIVLLEKSQRVLPSLAISPVKLWEYIISKVLSLAVISTVVGFVIGSAGGTHNLLFVVVGTFLGSIFFSVVGMLLAAKSNSLNGFIIMTIPVMLVLMLPALVEIFGFKYPLFDFHVGNIILRLIDGNTKDLFVMSSVFIIWFVGLYCLAVSSIGKMLKELGGVKL